MQRYLQEALAYYLNCQRWSAYDLSEAPRSTACLRHLLGRTCLIAGYRLRLVVTELVLMHAGQ